MSRCNLSCEYCYVYEHADQSWRDRPRVMHRETLRAAVEGVAEHVQAHAVATVDVILHGGEPLLAGAGYLDEAAGLIRGTLASVGADARISVQSNGLLLDENFLRVFHRHGIKVGISLDGDAVTHDRRRRRHDGRGSHAEVARAVDLLTKPAHRSLFGGLLGVVDLAADPLAYYEAMLEPRPPVIDLLLPHGTWDVPPPGVDPLGRVTPYADWLVPVFDRWYDAPRRETRIRFFEAIIMLCLGGRTTCESLGLGPIDLVSVETDGSIEQTDSLKVAVAGAPATGLHVSSDPFDAALEHPGIAARQQGIQGLSEACSVCPIVTICGGGLYTHRYRASNGFDNPSVFCADLTRLITHVVDRVGADLARLTGSAGTFAKDLR